MNAGEGYAVFAQISCMVSYGINVYNAQERAPDNTMVAEKLQVQNYACNSTVVCCGVMR